jgi:hypothetical protein
MLHVVCGGHNVGKTTFARYLQVGKKNVRRVCMEDLNYSIGMRSNNDNFFYALLTLLFVDGDVVIDGGDHNNAAQRVKTLKSLDRLGVSYRAFAYVIKRPVEQCYDDVYSDDEVDFSHQIQYPALREGFEKIMSVTWTSLSTRSQAIGLLLSSRKRKQSNVNWSVEDRIYSGPKRIRNDRAHTRTLPCNPVAT